MPKPRQIDLICCHDRQGEITPLRLRVKDDDGQYQSYTIRSYKDLSHQGTRITADGIYVTDKTIIFECMIHVFGQEKKVNLYCNEPYLSWTMTP